MSKIFFSTMVDHNYSKYLFILSIFIFITTVNCTPTTAAPLKTPDKKTINATNLLRLSFGEYKNTFCSSFDTVLADVDVIFNDIPNLNATHVNTLEHLDKAGKKVILYKMTLDDDLTVYTDVLADKLKELGYTKPIKIVNPTTAIKSHFTKIDLKGKAYVIGDNDFEHFVKALGIETIRSPDSTTYDDYYNSSYNALSSEVKSVFIGFDVNLNLYKVVQAFRYLNGSKVQLFMTRPKSIYGEKFHRAWIKYLVAKAKRTEQYIDISGIFGDYLVEENKLNDRVLAIPSQDAYVLNFIAKHKFKVLLLGKKIKITANDPIPDIFYSIDDFGSMVNWPAK